MARIEVPATIELVVLVAGAPKTSPSSAVRLWVEPVALEHAGRLFWHLSGLPEEEVRFPAVVPGAYKLQVKQFRQGPETTIGEPQIFDVAAPPDGGPARVTLRVEQR